MKRILTTSAALALLSSGALAAGLDRSGQGIDIMYESGNAIELSFGSVSPTVTGTLGGQDSGNVSASYSQVGFGLKTQVNDKLSLGLVFDQPYGANLSYPTTTTYPLRGTTGTVDTSAITAIARYDIGNNMAVFAGARQQTLSGSVAIPAKGYSASFASSSGTGYLVGAMYEKPEIALRVALTYNSSIKHDIATTENNVLNTTTTVNTPKSVNLDFQTGVAADTLVFGSVRWVDWKNFSLKPAGFAAGNAGAALLSYAQNAITYEAGVGRRINDKWSGAVTVGYEKAEGGKVSDLGPTDGFFSFGLGATYAATDTSKITLGAKYVKLGDATTANNASFTGNSAIGFGIKFSSSF